jgi:hypothetical protein
LRAVGADQKRKVVFGVVLAALGAVAVFAITRTSSSAQPAFHLSFDGASAPELSSLAPDRFRVDHGVLQVQGLMNRPVWVNHPLPHDVRVKVKARSMDPAGDIKVELFGDGHSGYQGDPRAAYTATGYILVMGGWNNTISAIARQHEHGHDRAERSDVRVEPGRWYEWSIERRGGQISWSVDGQPFLQLDDAQPLYDDQHQYFAFGDWTALLEFDDLSIEPL